jgi:hypothetical protein
MEVKFKNLLSANVTVTAESEHYSFSAEATVTTTDLNAINNGYVYKDGSQVANFNAWAKDQLSITFTNAGGEEVTITEDTKTFIDAVRDSVSTLKINME